MTTAVPGAPPATSDGEQDHVLMMLTELEAGGTTVLPIHRLLGGYRYRIQTSITLSLVPLKETVELARSRARQGFRILKLKGGIAPEEDVRENERSDQGGAGRVRRCLTCPA